MRFLIIAFVLIFTASPAHAATDYSAMCASKTDGHIYYLKSGTCSSSQYSLGTTALSQPTKRPTAINPILNNRFLAAKAAAARVGVKIAITSGYRTLSRQDFLFKRAIKKYGSYAKAARWVLPPKYSTHPWGLAIDVNYGSGFKSGAGWLEKYGYKWGLCRPYENEWWHFEAVNVPGMPCPARFPSAWERLQSGVLN